MKRLKHRDNYSESGIALVKNALKYIRIIEVVMHYGSGQRVVPANCQTLFQSVDITVSLPDSMREVTS